MENKHTPREWAAKESIIYSLETGQDVARCDIGGRDEQTEANARLIAAAPELLEALQAMVDGKERDLNVLITKAQQAINKAIGD